MNRPFGLKPPSSPFAAMAIMLGVWIGALDLLAMQATGAEAGKPAPVPAPEAQNSTATAKSYTPTPVKLTVARHPRDYKQILTYTLVTPPEHGTVQLPEPHAKRGGPATATYISARDYMGKDSFAWKVNDGMADSNVATGMVTVTAALAIADTQVGPVVANTATDIPAAYTGGGGYDYAIRNTNPEHGTLTVKGTTFHYTPTAGYLGPDAFAWTLACSNGPTGVPATMKTGTCHIVVKPAAMTDWPQWRADEWRSGFTTMELPGALHLQWRRDFPVAASAFAARGVFRDIDYCRPIQLGKTIFVPVPATDCLAAYNTDTGELRWRFYASGAVRRPPAAMALEGGKGIVILGSDDGWVYALNAADGSVRWKFRAAPNNRKAIGFGRLSSAWPVWASPVISGGRVYFAAGYIPEFALYAYCLDVATGAVVWVNDGRISDMWNNSALGPLALSYDGSRILGTVEGAAKPWVLDSSSGEFLGHLEVGFRYPGAFRNGSNGWYVDGTEACGALGRADVNPQEPMSIRVGGQTLTADSVAALGVTGTVASLLAGDGKLFATTAEGGLYCFAGKTAQPVIHPLKITPLPAGSDAAAAAVKAMLSRNDLKDGLALVCGIKDGRLIEELAGQSALLVVAVDPDGRKLQALRARMDDAGLSGRRVSTLEGNPLDFALPPYLFTLITSEDPAAAGIAERPEAVERFHAWARPFGGEIWLPTTDAQHAALAGFVKDSRNMPLSEVTRSGGYTQIQRTGLPDDQLRISPPFGLVAFGSERPLAASNPLSWVWKDRDVYTWLPMRAKGPGHVPPEPKHGDEKGYPTPTTMSTDHSIFNTLTNPLYGVVEKFPGVPSSGNDGSCTAIYNRYGDFGLTHGKIASIFDASAHYWGRMFFEAGGCPGKTFIWNGVCQVAGTPVPGSTCGCSPAMQFSNFSLAPMEGEENWINYQRERTASPVEDQPVSRVGINFGAPGDRLVPEEGLLWTHHPYAGRYGRCSYNYESMPEALPLVPVTYRGPVRSVYHHSAWMEPVAPRDRRWVAASQVLGMTGLTVHLAQPVVATRAAAPTVDGDLGDECWQGARRLVFAVDKTVVDRDKATGLPKPDEHVYAMLRYDDANLYIAAGAHVEYPRWATWGADNRRQMIVTINSRDRHGEDVVLTGGEKARQSVGLDSGAWSYASRNAGSDPFTAEMAIPWEKLAALGLWKEQLVINVSVSGSPLVAGYTPLYLDAARGSMAMKRPHTVRLYFAEMEGKAPGQRVFDVSLQGQTVLKALDVVKAAGGARRELMKEFKGVAIAEGLDIDFNAATGEPMLSGVEIVPEGAGAGAQAANAAPTAVLEASVKAGAAPLEVVFDARKSQDPDGQIVDCAWETGDGRLARGAMLHHVFAEPGTHQVQLLVRDDRGAMAATNVTVTVSAGVPAAFVCAIRAKGGDYATLSAWEAAMRSDLTAGTNSLLFAVKSRGKYAPADDGKAVTFTGGGKGTLRHINGGGMAYITDCTGAIQAGAVTCASGNAFEVADSGHPVITIVAECHHDWPDGLADKLAAGPGWKTDAIRSVTIRPAAGQGHTGRIRDAKGKYAGFAFKGDLDVSGLSDARVERVIVDPAGTVSTGPGASVSRALAGPVKLSEGGLAANSIAESFSVGHSTNRVNHSVSFYTMNLRDGRKQPRPPKLIPSRVGLYDCTAKTFDPGNQVEVEFVNCLAVPGGEGFRDAGYSEPGNAIRCVSTDGTAIRWDRGDGSEGNMANQPVSRVDVAGADAARPTRRP